MARAFVAASSQYVEYQSVSGDVPAGTWPVTLACWFKANSLQQAFLVSLSTRTGTHYVSLVILANGHLRAQFDPGTGAILAETTASYTPGVWHHACAVFHPVNNRSIYLDGSNAVSAGSLSSWPASLDTISVGRIITSGVGSNYFDGSIAEAFIVSRDLSASEVAALASGITPSRSVVMYTQSLYWPLWGVASPEPDAMGGGRSGTVTGASLANHAPVGRYAPVMPYVKRKSTFVPAVSGLYVPQRTLRGVGI